ncbi:MAG: hypothetical protein WKG07_37205 [Hymenobacter sp.]
MLDRPLPRPATPLPPSPRMSTIKGTILNEVTALAGKVMKLTPDLPSDPLLTASQFVGKPYPAWMAA